MPVDIEFNADDGQTLRGTIHDPVEPADTWLLVNSAMGVRRRFYRHLALYLAGRNIGVLTYDYRGLGDSVLEPGQAARVQLQDWGLQDFPAAMGWLRSHRKVRRLVILGHSVGGQFLGLTPRILEVDGLVGVASQSGYWRHWHGTERAKVFTMWYVAIPLLTAIATTFPASRFGLGQDIPAGVARQWASWGRDPDYIRSDRVGPQPQYYDAIRCALRTYCIENDPLASEPSVHAWHAWFPNAEREFVKLGAQEASGPRMDHFGFFKPDIGGAQWPALADFIEGR
ncbi:MAG: alpha/beta fold hydrolase [Gammaproteobacteria bacterium]